MVKTHSKLETEDNFYSLIKDIYGEPTAKIILSGDVYISLKRRKPVFNSI